MGSGAEGCSAIGAALNLFVHVGVDHRTCFMQLVPMCPENCARNLAQGADAVAEGGGRLGGEGMGSGERVQRDDRPLALL